MTQLNKKTINHALQYLETVPQVKRILNNLTDIKYDFADNLRGAACFINTGKIIFKNTDLDLNEPENRLAFYTALAHELCHADQKHNGIHFTDLYNASFGDTFRISKMMEVEGFLFYSMVANDLIKRPEFQDCYHSVHSIYYQAELQIAKGDVSLANTNFALTYWQNAKDTYINIPEVRKTINSFYVQYTQQAFHQALLMHDPHFTTKSSNRSTPLEAMNKYISRMKLTNVNPELFLQNNFDNAQTTNNYQDGVTILDRYGNKHLNLAQVPEKPFTDKFTYFDNNEPYTFVLVDTITRKQIGTFRTINNQKEH